MWCNVCQCDVVTEVTADNSRAICSTCGQVLSAVAAGQPRAPAHSDEASPRAEARDLLDRWASSHLFDPYGPPKNNVGTTAAPTTDQAAPPSIPHTHAYQPPADPTAGIAQPQPNPVHLSAAPAPYTPPQYPQPQSQPAHHNPPQTFDAGAFAPGVPQPTASQPSASLPNASQPVGLPPAGAAGSTPDFASSHPSPAAPPQYTPLPATAGYARHDPPRSDGIPPPDRNLQSSSEELDRLTNEILSRVSEISEDRRRRIEQVAAQLPTDSDADIEPETSFGQGIDLSRQPENLSRETDSSQLVHDSSDDFGESTSSVEPSEVAEDSEVDHAATASSFGTPQTATVSAPATPAADNPASGSGLPGIGHILSYVGILGLTAGTSFVIVGYFGGPPSYAPTGWLVSTVGQMLLFLGIVTLVSNGMEQSSEQVQNTVNDRMDELSGRMETLGERLIRIESAESSGPRRPHLLNRPVGRREASTIASDSRR